MKNFDLYLHRKDFDEVELTKEYLLVSNVNTEKFELPDTLGAEDVASLLEREDYHDLYEIISRLAKKINKQSGVKLTGKMKIFDNTFKFGEEKEVI
jgi:hypothetical protein